MRRLPVSGHSRVIAVKKQEARYAWGVVSRIDGDVGSAEVVSLKHKMVTSEMKMGRKRAQRDPRGSMKGAEGRKVHAARSTFLTPS
jgi:hypothetical protein